MKRFLTLMGVAVVAAAMYVAASPASRQASRPTAKQFKALKRQVATLSKRVNSLKKVTAAELVLLSSCDQGAAPIAQYGDTSAAPKEGYEYQAAGAPAQPPTLTTALDLVPQPTASTGWFAFGSSACGSLLNAGALRHAAAMAGIRLPQSTTHLPSLKAHRP